MGILKDFLGSIKNLIDKKYINLSVDNVHDVLDELRPVVEQVAAAYNVSDIKDSDLKYIVTSFYEVYNGRNGVRKNIYQDIGAGMLNLERNLETVADFIEKNVAKKIIQVNLEIAKMQAKPKFEIDFKCASKIPIQPFFAKLAIILSSNFKSFSILIT